MKENIKIAVVYRSMTGHSKKLATAIGAKFAVTPQDLKTNQTVPQCDVLVVVGGIYSGDSLPDMKEFVNAIAPSSTPKVVLVSSSATGKGQTNVTEAFKNKGIDILGEYICYGGFVILKMFHPNKQEIADAVTFVDNII
jgi:flavodoxin